MRMRKVVLGTLLVTLLLGIVAWGSNGGGLTFGINSAATDTASTLVLKGGSNVTVTDVESPTETHAVTFAVTGAPPNGNAGGDLSGTYPNPGVAKVAGQTVNAAGATNNQVWLYDLNAGQWKPTATPTIGSLTVTGNVSTTTKIQSDQLDSYTTNTTITGLQSIALSTGKAIGADVLYPATAGNTITSQGHIMVSADGGAKNLTVTGTVSVPTIAAYPGTVNGTVTFSDNEAMTAGKAFATDSLYSATAGNTITASSNLLVNSDGGPKNLTVTGRIISGAGSASSPAVAVGRSASGYKEGMYQQAAGSLSLSAKGAETFRLDNTSANLETNFLPTKIAPTTNIATDGTGHYLSVVQTMPVFSTFTAGILFDLTPAATSVACATLRADMEDGMTSNSRTAAIEGVDHTTGASGNDHLGATLLALSGNSAAQYVGVYAAAKNAGSGQSFAGFFNCNGGSGDYPSTSSVIGVDNFGQTSIDIARFYSNKTLKDRIDSTGNVTTTAVLYSDTLASYTGSTTVTCKDNVGLASGKNVTANFVARAAGTASFTGAATNITVTLPVSMPSAAYVPIITEIDDGGLAGIKTFEVGGLTASSFSCTVSSNTGTVNIGYVCIGY